MKSTSFLSPSLLQQLRPSLQRSALKALAMVALTTAGTAQAGDLTIELSNLGDATGKVMLNLLRNDAQMQNAEPAEASMMLNPSADGIRFTLHNLPAGTYGVQVMHDENGNGELDANLVGMPKEPWGFSNNAKGRFGPPKWQDVQFTIDSEAVVQSITLN